MLLIHHKPAYLHILKRNKAMSLRLSMIRRRSVLAVMAALGLMAVVRNPAQDAAPAWPRDDEFARDVFTFVRIRYNSYNNCRGWRIDYPDSDLNISYRLQQLTSIEVDPDGKVLTFKDKRLFDYPFIYIVEPG